MFWLMSEVRSMSVATSVHVDMFFFFFFESNVLMRKGVFSIPPCVPHNFCQIISIPQPQPYNHDYVSEGDTFLFAQYLINLSKQILTRFCWEMKTVSIFLFKIFLFNPL